MRGLYNILSGTWYDTGVAMMDGRQHVCQCLHQRLPRHLHSLSLHVAADEASVRVHGEQAVQINGELSLPEFSDIHVLLTLNPVERDLGVAGAFALAFNMLTLL